MLRLPSVLLLSSVLTVAHAAAQEQQSGPSAKVRILEDAHKGSVLSVAFSPDGQSLASASRDNTIKLWDVRTGKERASLKGHSVMVWSVAFSPDGKTLAWGDHDTTVRLWAVPPAKKSDK